MGATEERGPVVTEGNTPALQAGEAGAVPAGSTTFVIADLHGRYDLLVKAVDKIHAYSSGGKIITLGDYVDRGPESASIIRYLQHTHSAGGWSYVHLMGNHEDMMMQCLSGVAEMNWWFINGGEKTVLSYTNMNRDPVDDVKFLVNLPLFHEDKHRIYVHAGIDPLIPMDRQKRHDMLWKLYNHNTDVGHYPTGKHVVHGHHQFANGPKLWRNRTNLDTFAWATGRLVVGVFSDNIPGGPVDQIEVIGKPDDRAKFILRP